MKLPWILIALPFLVAKCAAPANQPTAVPAATPPAGMTQTQVDTLNSLKLVDDYPLYTMHYVGPYTGQTGFAPSVAAPTSGETCPAKWGCSLFATLGDEGNRLYGRNFDWKFSPAVLLFTDPPDGYASVSMVDIAYLGFDGDRSRKITDLSLQDRRALLDAPWLPFDGMNEKGLAIGMAAVDAEEMPNVPTNKSTDNLGIIREMLDHAATVEEAIGIMGSYNIDMGSVPVHYLIASADGDSALVEFMDAEMKVFRNETSWQAATNFMLAYMDAHPEGECPRYDRIARQLTQADGRLSFNEAFGLLQDVSQENTQWSILYQMTDREVGVVMGQDYGGQIYTFHLE